MFVTLFSLSTSLQPLGTQRPLCLRGPPQAGTYRLAPLYPRSPVAKPIRRSHWIWMRSRRRSRLPREPGAWWRELGGTRQPRALTQIFDEFGAKPYKAEIVAEAIHTQSAPRAVASYQLLNPHFFCTFHAARLPRVFDHLNPAATRGDNLWTYATSWTSQVQRQAPAASQRLQTTSAAHASMRIRHAA